MIGSPPNWQHRARSRCMAPAASRRTERCVSERKPISARNGAKTSGAPACSATSEAGTLQLDDHHAVERADQQTQGHADRELDHRQAQQAVERQVGVVGIGEGQHFHAQRDQRPINFLSKLFTASISIRPPTPTISRLSLYNA